MANQEAAEKAQGAKKKKTKWAAQLHFSDRWKCIVKATKQTVKTKEN